MNAAALALLLLRERFGRFAETREALAGLAGFQQEAVSRLEQALERYGGAILADSVGLGKTHVGAAVARSAAVRGEAVLAIVPTSLLRQWRRALHGIGRLALATHATLSRGGVHARPGGLLVVDEAHAFRNPRTRRYAALARLVTGRDLLLITATPVNNSLWDLYWLLRLFAADDAFLDLGVPDLFSAVREAERSGRTGRIPAVLARVAVRRTRAHVVGERRVAGAASLPLRFPTRAPPRPLMYEVDVAARRALLGTIEALRLEPWRINAPAAPALLLRLTLLKRLESSTPALRASLERLSSALTAFREALAEGALLAPAQHRERQAGRPEQLVLDALLRRPLPPQLDAQALARSADHDCALLRDALGAIGAAHEDPKLRALRSFIGEARGRPLLVFTEYRETAEHLWMALAGDVPVALIHGSAAYLGRSRASRRAVVERFAPRANHAQPPPLRERVQVLIATDVLAEGLNLQDAADLVSYDLPWNPVRLLQRMGRIDRLGSPHRVVRCAYFAPDRDLDALLGLMRRIERKLHAIRASVGEDAAVLAAGADGARLPDWERIERQECALFDIEERLRAALARAESAMALQELPLGRTAPEPAPATRDRVAALTRPAGAAFAAVDGLVLVGRGAAQRAVVVAGRRCYEDDVLAGEVLLAALAEPESSACRAAPAEGERLRRAALRWLARPAPAAPPPRDLRPLRRQVLRLLQERPGGPTEAECRRAEAIVARLRRGLPAGRLVALSRFARVSSGERDLDTLLHGIEHLLAEGAVRTAARPSPSPTPEVAGVLLLANAG